MRVAAFRTIFICFTPLFALNVGAATVNGSIHGSVIDDTGKPVAGARVVISYSLPSAARKFTAPPVITGPFAQDAMTDSTGGFEVAAIRAGQYTACAQTLAPGLLDPCRWSTAAPELTVIAGQTLTGVRITMAHGAIIPIHVNDPQGLLTPVTGPIDFACQFHAVTAKGIHYNADIQASTATGRDHSITVPFGALVTLQVISPHLKLNDASGNAVTAQGTAVNAPFGSALATLVYTVTGTK